MSLLKTSLKVRLAIALGVMALASALVLSQVASYASRAQIERDQSALLQNIAVRMTSQLAHDMSARANEIAFLAGQDQVRDPKYSLEAKQAMFERVRNAYPFYAWIGMADLQGNIVAGTGGLLVGKNVSQRDWFLKAQEELHFGDAHDAFLLAKMLPKPKWDDLPLRLVDISTPVRDATGKLIGVLCGHLSLDWAFEVRESMLDQLSRDDLDLVVLNKAGKVLMGTPHLPSLKVDLAALQTYQGLEGATRQVAVETWPDGGRYLTASVREASFKNYPGMGWTIVARRGEASAFAPADRLSQQILLAGVATAAVFIFVVLFMLQRELGPLAAIATAAKRIRDDGNRVEIPKPERSGELSDFASALIDLANTLQTSNAELVLAGRVFDESGQGILITDASNKVIRVNRAFTRITGYSSADIVGLSPKVLQSGHQDAAFYQTMWSAVKRNGAWQGEIWNRTKDGRIYPEWLTINVLTDADGTVTHHIAIFDDITEKKDYEKRLVHLANYDKLTDLPNRNLMQMEVELMLRDAKVRSQTLGLMFVDLDNFKNINDTLGHPAGDQVLQEVAKRFTACVEQKTLVSRWGGDEFVVALPHGGVDEAAALARRLIEVLQRPFAIEGGRYHLGMSVGVAMYPADGETVNQLLRCADTAMYRAKSEGNNQLRFYVDTMNAGLERYLKIDNALRHALDQDGLGLSLAFQPQFSGDGKSIMGAEALIRWSHPELGAISPAQFIPVAEETGLILPLGRWIMEEIARSYRDIVMANRVPVALSMNCSAHQLVDAGLAAQLHAACQKMEVPAEHLRVEVTESAIMSDEFKVMDTLGQLRKYGYPVSIDDFGTGYSCLNYIQKIRPSEIKVDQGFVKAMLTDPDSHSIVLFTVRLAESMGMDVVAEGVETEAQRTALNAMGNVKLQGFLLGKPLPLQALIALLPSASES